MKKLIFVLALMIGGAGAFTIQSYALPAPQVCDVNRPCLYSGKAYKHHLNNSLYIPDIRVYFEKGSNRILASFYRNNEEQVVYVFQTNDGKYYFTWDGEKYYFEM